MSSAAAEWEALKDALQAEEGIDHDPIFEAQAAAQDACGTLVQTLREHLDALEAGSLKPGDRDAILEETSSLLQTVKRKAQEVEVAEEEEQARQTAFRQTLERLTLARPSGGDDDADGADDDASGSSPAMSGSVSNGLQEFGSNLA